MYPSVKISDFPCDSWNKLNETTDLFLKSQICENTSEASIPIIIDEPYTVLSAMYTSNTTTLQNFYNTILTADHDINSLWTFDSGSNPSQILVRYYLQAFFDYYYKKKARLDSIIGLNGEYASNFGLTRTGLKDSTTIDQRTVATAEYTNRLFAMVYSSLKDTILKLIRMLIEVSSTTYYLPSFVGQIVHGTQTITKEDALRKLYGDGTEIYRIGGLVVKKPDTHWIQHSGNYVLRCGKEGEVKRSSANADGGDNSKCRITPDKLPAHDHGVSNHNHGSVTIKVSGNATNAFLVSASPGTDSCKGTGGRHCAPVDFYNTSAIVADFSGDGMNNATLVVKEAGSASYVDIDIQQASKNCLIWERVS